MECSSRTKTLEGGAGEYIVDAEVVVVEVIALGAAEFVAASKRTDHITGPLDPAGAVHSGETILTTKRMF
jgi:hypothetical protein